MRPEKVEENIVTFHGSWQQGDTFNILLEYADKGSLSDYFQKVPPPQEGKDIVMFWKSFIEVVKALCRIHELRVEDESTELRKSVLQG